VTVPNPPAGTLPDPSDAGQIPSSTGAHAPYAAVTAATRGTNPGNPDTQHGSAGGPSGQYADALHTHAQGDTLYELLGQEPVNAIGNTGAGTVTMVNGHKNTMIRNGACTFQFPAPVAGGKFKMLVQSTGTVAQPVWPATMGSPRPTFSSVAGQIEELWVEADDTATGWLPIYFASALTKASLGMAELQWLVSNTFVGNNITLASPTTPGSSILMLVQNLTRPSGNPPTGICATWRRVGGRAFGYNWPEPYEVDVINLGSITSGVVVVSFARLGVTYTTAPFAWNASNATLQAALLAATGPHGETIPAGVITVTGGPLPAATTITFSGAWFGAITDHAINASADPGHTIATFAATTPGGVANQSELWEGSNSDGSQSIVFYGDEGAGARGFELVELQGPSVLAPIDGTPVYTSITQAATPQTDSTTAVVSPKAGDLVFIAFSTAGGYTAFNGDPAVLTPGKHIVGPWTVLVGGEASNLIVLAYQLNTGPATSYSASLTQNGGIGAKWEALAGFLTA
jgi:hypothetical protein